MKIMYTFKRKDYVHIQKKRKETKNNIVKSFCLQISNY